MKRIQIELAGHENRYLVCDSVHSICGKISDGVCFFFSDGPGSYQGSWLMRFEDLKRLYETVAAEYASPPAQ